jgi:two-component system, cell cycle response regulator DivK
LIAPRVLIVDDNPMNIAIAECVLQAEMFEVETAADGLEAMQKVASFRPDLILMDIQMPGRNGLDVTRDLKADATTRDIRIVAFTAFAMRGDEKKMRAAGCDGYLSKPIDVKTFGAQVRACLHAPMGNGSGPAGAPGPERSALHPLTLASQALSHAASSKLISTPRLLIVDDEPDFLESVAALLEIEGFEVSTHCDPRSAVAAVRDGFKPDVVLLDFRMPGLNGPQTLQQMRGCGLEAPAVLVSAMAGLASASAAAGFDGALSKPFATDEIVGLLRRVLSGERGPDGGMA